MAVLWVASCSKNESDRQIQQQARKAAGKARVAARKASEGVRKHVVSQDGYSRIASRVAAP